MPRLLTLCLALLGLSALAACESMRSWTPAFVQPYRPDVQQGNVVTLEMVELLRPGMTRDQVRFLLGTPLLTDPYHPERWDYYFSVSAGSEVKERYRATLYFSDERLVRIEREGPIPEKDAPQLKPQR